MNIPERRPAPGYFRRFYQLVIQGGKITTANFTDIFADVYEDRPVFFLDRELSFSFMRKDNVTYRDLATVCNRIGNGLKDLGVTPGDRVGFIRVRKPPAKFEIYNGY